MIPVYEDGKIIARVEYNTNLDFWDGNNWTCGSTGRHLGIVRLKKRKQFVLIHGTQWAGQKDTAEVVSDEEAFQAIMAADQPGFLDDWPDLKRFVEELDGEEA